MFIHDPVLSYFRRPLFIMNYDRVRMPDLNINNIL